MAEPRRVTALDTRERELAGVGARAILLGSQISVRADAGSAGDLGLPTDPNTWSGVDGRDALWLGPDEWLVVSETEPADTIVDDVRRRLAGRHHSVVDVSANRVMIELTGPRRTELLQAGCGIDLHPRAWREGTCAQTLLANVAVLLQERNDATRVFLRPSFAGHLVTWLARVAADFAEG
ncbi:MAG: sarcosine oxidase subunit gamma [Actinomycetota bacterium]